MTTTRAIRKTCASRHEFWKTLLSVLEVYHASLTPKEKDILAYSLEMDSKDPFHGMAFLKIQNHYAISNSALQMYKKNLKEKKWLTSTFLLNAGLLKIRDYIKSTKRYSFEIPILIEYIEEEANVIL